MEEVQSLVFAVRAVFHQKIYTRKTRYDTLFFKKRKEKKSAVRVDL